MPPRWSRVPTRQDPDFRRLDDRMTFAVHVALFAASNSGIWFVRTVQAQSWPWSIWVTAIWFAALVAHGLVIFAIADYSKK
ncbi:2TM domain-containing protein [Vacuolonema iberomarrocanum]|uniref:2TM domain-containing protein n=1 Tax=Vacuolonema iberomarrocanum TaxID=3454632 RepID=UPI0019EBE1E9|nr:2TM domain-containing protein [filamentous cyanobacterium LEGE 07170]